MHYERKIKYLDYYESGEKIRGAGFLKLEVKEDKLRLELTVKGLYPTDTFDREVLLHSDGREAALGQICIQNGNGSFRYVGDSEQDIGGTGISYAALREIRIPIGGTRELICPLTETARMYKGQPQSVSQMNMQPQEEEKASGMAEAQNLPVMTEAQKILVTATDPLTAEAGKLTETAGKSMEPAEAAEVISEVSEMPSEASEVMPAEADISGEGKTVPEEAEVSAEAEEPSFDTGETSSGMTWAAARPAETSSGMEWATARSAETSSGMEWAAAKPAEMSSGTEWAAARPAETSSGMTWTAAKPAGTSAAVTGAAMAEEMLNEAAPTATETAKAPAVAEKQRDTQESIELQKNSPAQPTDAPEVQKEVQGQGLSKKLWAELGKAEAKVPQDRSTSREVRKSHSDKSKKPINMREEKWQQLSALYPHIQPFHDKRDYLSICPADFVLFPSKFYKAVNNSFLLHGYYNYDHLILARIKHRGEIQYYIGVPGTYFDREKQVAVMFGFESFECASEPAQTGDFGYYMMRMEL